MAITPDAHFATLDRTISDQVDYALALRYAPRIRFDVREPFLPSAAGYSVFHADGKSASFPREIQLPARATCAIEYAIWWDWDIQHLYELEHIWVYLDAQEQIVAVDASWHGGYHPMWYKASLVPVEDGRVTLFSEPGKHAFAPVIDWLLKRQPTTNIACGRRSGRMGVHVPPLFDGLIHDRKPLKNNVVQAYLERRAFGPSYEFSQRFELADVALVP